MIIQDLVLFLNEKMSVGVYTEQPEQLTGYILLDQTGSSRKDFIVTTTIAIQSYGDSLYNAMLLNEALKEAMVDFQAEPNVTRVELQTDYNYTNTASKQYRWQAVYLITHYA